VRSAEEGIRGKAGGAITGNRQEAPPAAVIFDIGGVLIDWNPRYLYRQLFSTTTEMEGFLADICTPAWNRALDAGRPFAEAVAALSRTHPALAPLIAAYDRRWEDMVRGPIQPTVTILRRLAAMGVPLYALTNFSAEKFPLMRTRFDFLEVFAGIVVSGEVGLVKPDARFYAVLVERYRLDRRRCLFIDDAPENVAAAIAFGMPAIRFTGAGDLARHLADRGLTVATAAGDDDSPR
jgi:2-haloacid dehalogenase